jgi:hypothetical protein
MLENVVRPNSELQLCGMDMWCDDPVLRLRLDSKMAVIPRVGLEAGVGVLVGLHQRLSSD